MVELKRQKVETSKVKKFLVVFDEFCISKQNVVGAIFRGEAFLVICLLLITI